ncbi:short-chain dehydrogenase/reductase [Bordetella genomosp. 8]|uniref:Short-chain dehydrogenase/reductase n=1 Tax=Bordetella genomosp. 8 TaxID=1416806 RepID=A0A1W6YU19_9BORD|nr:oxidoreductase [Bordetella genomosp. 8]ARP84586.1 short-chain dehydrogenase/reductase [Bordetella genomosp. 8]
MSNVKNILITGVSSGLGRAMAHAALARGHRVIGTVRQDAQRHAFEALAPGRALARLLDVRDTAGIQALVQELEATLGAIDVLINNAGYGLVGVLEELDLEALRQQFEVNVYGPVALIQAVLPGMRKRRAGHIVNVSSMGGMVAFPGLSAYHGTKFALLGMTDSLRQEVRDLGIHVTAILPGIFSSDWFSRSQQKADHAIDDYDAVVNATHDFAFGDPAALGRVMVDAIEMNHPPEKLLIGPTAVRLVTAALADWQAEIARWETLSHAGGQG